jgi:large subunit ribosomal protein L13
MKTFSAKNETVKRDWYIVDASGKTLGRLCSELATRLRGKHKPVYTPHVDTGDYIVVVNAEKIRVTGNKLQDKMYHRFTGYIGNLKSENLGRRWSAPGARDRDRASRACCRRTRSAAPCSASSRSTRAPKHPHTAQQPQPLENLRDRHGDFAELRHRPSQVLHRARVPAPGKGNITVNERSARRVLRSRDRAHDRAPAARADQARPRSST